MTDSREARNHACEVKFVVDRAGGEAIRAWARAHLEPDPHGTGPFADEYDTSSLYFDTAQHDVFCRQGSYGRAKYRIRRYSDADFAFLERKLRKPRLVVKRRTRVPLDEIPRLRRRTPGAPWVGSWFGARLDARRLGPACQVSYRRLARGANGSQPPVRLTLDEGMVARPASELAFADGEGEALLPGRMILELKFRGYLPALFRRLVEEFALWPACASKYRLAMIALGHVVATDDEGGNVNGEPAAGSIGELEGSV
ncbi:MAG: polyphosphate polymerase domain-containing protein [Acidobacteria bacterium]|nr:polyphosphate polymerase domain-containing protein [Acidobacteriota bacterium]